MSTVIIGNLVDTPSVKFTNNGTAVCNFSVAVTRKKGNEDYTSYFDCQAWGTLAQNLSASMSKGDRVFVNGSLTQDRYEKDGQKRSSVVLTADNAGPDLRFATASVSKVAKKSAEADF